MQSLDWAGAKHERSNTTIYIIKDGSNDFHILLLLDAISSSSSCCIVIMVLRANIM